MRASAFGVALVAAGAAGMIIGLLGALTGNPTVGEQKWYWLTTAIALLPLGVGFGWSEAHEREGDIGLARPTKPQHEMPGRSDRPLLPAALGD
jgi:hypothetical protein